MVDIRKISKSAIGKSLTPPKIYKFNYKKELEQIHQKLYFDNLNYKTITNLYVISVFITISFFLYTYENFYSIGLINPYFYNIITKTIVIGIALFIENIIFYYIVLFVYFFIHDSKFKKNEAEIEKDLPEFLDNLVSNLKGGISLEKALQKSVRPEQEALLTEITLINQKILMGTNTFEALKGFRERYDSQIINRTFFLIEEGIKNGGNIAAPLERISENLKRIYNLNDEIKANSGGFGVVIKAITVLVAPILFALAITLLRFIGDLLKIMAESGTDLLAVGEIPDEYTQYLIIFSYAMISLITLFSSLITSELKNEKIHESIKYIPIYIAIAIGIYIIAKNILLNIFTSII